MSSRELYQKYLEAEKERFELENKIDVFVQKWANGETTLSTKLVEETVNKGYDRLEDLKQLESQLHTEYMNQDKKEEEKSHADISVRHNLGVMPSQTEITGGVLSSNANESHLVGQQKTPEQLEQEKNYLLSQIKNKVMNKEISLADASKLTADVNNSYGFYESPIERKSDGMNR